jgi:hypothetical protein
MKFQNFKISVFSLVVLFSLFFSQSVLAKDEVDVEDSIGINVDGKFIFNENLIYPGWYTSKTVSVENKSDSNVDLYVTFDLDNGEKLADVLNVYVVRIRDNNYKLGGLGDEYTIYKANKKDLYIERLESKKKEKYNIIVEFDKNAGNDYQNLVSQFDIDFTIEGETVENDSDTERQVLARQNRVVSGQAPTGNSFEVSDNIEEEPIALNVEDKKEEIKKENKPVISEKKDEGIVAGEQTCQNRWPFWVWVLLVIIYLVLNSFVGFNSETKEDNKTSLFWQSILLIISLVIWYLFDNCWAFIWVPIVEIISGIILAIIFYKNEERA